MKMAAWHPTPTFIGKFGAGLLAAVLWTLSVPHGVQAAPGDLDRRFGRRGKVVTDFGAEANALVLQPDGKLVAAGWGGTGDFALARYQGE